jgi:hypothetical protein
MYERERQRERQTTLGLGYLYGGLFLLILSLSLFVLLGVTYAHYVNTLQIEGQRVIEIQRECSSERDRDREIESYLWWFIESVIERGIHYLSLYLFLHHRIEDFSAQLVYVLTWRKFHHARFETTMVAV